MSAEQVALDHYRQRRRLIDAATSAAETAWRQVEPSDLDRSWEAVSGRVEVTTAGAQLAAAQTADSYVAAALVEQGLSPATEGRVVPRTLAGIASDGRDLAELLRQSVIATKLAIGSGASIDRAMATGLTTLNMIVRTQVADAGRVADGLAITTRPAAGGYVRMVVGKTCSRCLVLAGRWYRWNAGFDRHPRCDCTGIPSQENIAGDVRTNPRVAFETMDRAEQDRVFTKAGAQAIRDGANMNQVVNARRGMTTAAGPSGRRRLVRDSAGNFTTTESTTRRGVARPGRLMPESIYEQARDRAEAIRLLRLSGYIT